MLRSFTKHASKRILRPQHADSVDASKWFDPCHIFSICFFERLHGSSGYVFCPRAAHSNHTLLHCRFFINAVQPYDTPAGWNRGHLDFSATMIGTTADRLGWAGLGWAGLGCRRKAPASNVMRTPREMTWYFIPKPSCIGQGCSVAFWRPAAKCMREVCLETKCDVESQTHTLCQVIILLEAPIQHECTTCSHCKMHA